MNNKIVIILLLWLPFSNCNSRGSDAYSASLGNGYFYISSSNRSMIYRGEIENPKTHVLKISGNVERYSFDDRFIIAFRQITPLELRDSNTNALFKEQYDGDTLQYWIIDKIIDSTYGPLDSTKNELLLDQLNISPKIKLR